VSDTSPQPGQPAAGEYRDGFGGAVGSRAWSRRFGRLQVAERWLAQCRSARFGAWLARAFGFGFAMMALSAARPLPEASVAVLRLALITLSWCVGLAAVSLAGPALERWLVGARGLLENHGIQPALLRAERPLLLVYWSIRKLGILVALVVVACLVGTRDPAQSGHLLALAAGALVYLVALGGGLGVAAHLCERLGGSRGQSLLLGVLLLPELVSPAWPELPTLIASYSSLLDLCLGLGSFS
jgi:hypothetical protein